MVLKFNYSGIMIPPPAPMSPPEDDGAHSDDAGQVSGKTVIIGMGGCHKRAGANPPGVSEFLKNDLSKAEIFSGTCFPCRKHQRFNGSAIPILYQ
jgi:hypothetical protein